MAINFSYTPPLQKPIDLSVNVISGGGNWSAGTYKFRVQTGNVGLNSKPNNVAVASPASDIVQVDVSEGDQIQINFDPVDPSAQYFSMHFEDFTGISDYWNWTAADNGSVEISTLPYTYIEPHHPWYNYYYNPIQYYPIKVGGLPVDQGWAHLEISGDGDFTIADINNYLRSVIDSSLYNNIWIDGDNYGLYFNGNINCGDIINGNFNINNNIIFTTRSILTPSTLMVNMDSVNWINVVNNIGNITPNITRYNFNEVYLFNDQNASNASIYLQNDSSSWIKNSIIDNLLDNIDLTYIGENTIYLRDGSNIRLTNLNKITLKGGAYFVKTNESLVQNSDIYVDWISYIFLVKGDSDLNTEFRNCRFISLTDYKHVGYGIDVSAGNIIDFDDLFWKYPFSTYSYSNETGTGIFFFSNTYNLTVKNNINLPLENCSVIIKDASNNEVFNDYTDINGNISTILTNIKIEPKINSERAYNEASQTRVDLNPYTITISKEEYQTYQSVFNIIEKTDITISLQKINYIDRLILFE